MSERLELLKDQLLAAVDGDPAESDTDPDDEFGTLIEAAKSLPTDFDRPAWSIADDSTEPLPNNIGPFRVLDVLGSGGMGVVYRAQQPAPLARQVALKVIRPGLVTPSGLARFELESSALARLCHPNIAAVLETGTCQNDQPYVAMELVEGDAITDYARSGNLSLVDRLRMMQTVCAAVAHAHARGVIHRDLKPSNILVVERDEQPIPKIIDFGIARVHDTDLEERLTLTDQLLGTLEYLSPEVIHSGAGVADARSDVYALGAILYELVVGVPAVSLGKARGSGILKALEAVQHAVITRPVDRLAQIDEPHSVTTTDIGSDLNCIILHSLEKEPDDRYQSPSDLAEDLERYLIHKPIAASPPSKSRVVAKFIRRHRIAVATLSIITLSLFAGLTAAIVGYIQSEQSRAIAVESQQESETALELLGEAAMLADTRDPRVKARFAKLGDRIESVLESKNFRSPKVKFRLQTMLANAYTSNAQYEKAGRLIDELFISTQEDWASGDDRFKVLQIRTDNRIDRRQFEEAVATAKLAKVVAGENKNQIQQFQADALLAKALMSHGQLREASTIYKRLIDENARLSAADPELGTAKAEVMLATILVQTGKKTEAEQYARSGYDQYRQRYGMTNYNSLMSGQNLASILTANAKHEEAIKVFRDIFAARKVVLGPTHPDTLTTAAMLGRTLIATSQFNEGESILKNTLKLGEETYPTKNPIGLLASKSLALLYDKQQRPDQAIEFAQKAVKYSEAKHGTNHWRVQFDRIRLAIAYKNAKQPEEAVTIAKDAHQILTESVGPNHPYTKAAAKCLASARNEQVSRQQR